MSGIMEVREFQERYRNRKMNKTKAVAFDELSASRRVDQSLREAVKISLARLEEFGIYPTYECLRRCPVSRCQFIL